MANKERAIIERVVSLAKDIEDEGIRRDRFLDIEYKVTSRGNVKEVYGIVTIGGPHLEVRCLGGTVHGVWDGTHTTHVDSDELKELGKHLAREFEETMLA